MKPSSICLMAAGAVMVAFFICFTLVTFGVPIPVVVAPIFFWVISALGITGFICLHKETS